MINLNDKAVAYLNDCTIDQICAMDPDQLPAWMLPICALLMRNSPLLIAVVSPKQIYTAEIGNQFFN